MDKNAKIYIAGHTGLVGSSIFRLLSSLGYTNLIVRTHTELDLTNQEQVAHFFAEQQPEYVFLAAAKVGGILANKMYPAEFIYDNLNIESHVIHCAWQHRVKRLLFTGSACIYPKIVDKQPITEETLLTGQLEPTNEPYAIAKIAGIKLCESYNRQYGTDFRSIMPNNLYGPKDNFHPKDSHVIPALIRRFHEAKINQDETVTVWGSGQAMREFLFVDDMAKACLFLIKTSTEHYQNITHPMLSHVNVSSGNGITIKTLSETIKKIINFEGDIVWNKDMPDGFHIRLLDINKISELGWQAQIGLEDGLSKTYQWFLAHQGNYRG